jgi:hypothetical protein
MLLLTLAAGMVLFAVSIVSAQPYHNPSPACRPLNNNACPSPGGGVTTAPASPTDSPTPSESVKGGVIVDPNDPNVENETEDEVLGVAVEEPQERTPTALPFTGADLVLFLMIAGATIATGTALVRLTRRRKEGGV